MGIYDSSVAFRSRQNELQDIGLSGQDDLSAGFGERFTSANELTFNRYTPLGRDRAFEDKYRSRDKILMDAGLISEQLLTSKRIMDRQESGNYPALKSNLLGRPLQDQHVNPQLLLDFPSHVQDTEINDNLLMDLRAAHPELEILSDEEIASNVMMDQLEIIHRDEDLAERSTFLGKVGFLTGSMVGWLRDPTHFLSSLVGLTPAGRLSMLQNFFRVGAAEASIIGALELSEKKGEVGFRRRTGEESLTTSEAAIESAFVVGGGFLLGGAVGATIGRFSRPIARSDTANNVVDDATQDVLDRIRDQQSRGATFDPEIEQAADLIDEALQVARSAPEEVPYEVHMQKYADARTAIAEGNNVPGPDDLSSLVRASDADVSAPNDSLTFIPNAELSVQDRAILDLRQTLDVEDVITQSTSASGDISSVSSREILSTLDSENAAVRATITCLG